MTRRFTLVVAAVSSLAIAQDRPPTPPPDTVGLDHTTDTKAADAKTGETPAIDPAKAQIQKLDDSRLRIGEVTLNQKTREIRFPTKVNMAAGLLEYLLCMPHGKVHEALLTTEASPIHLRMAFLLLRYPTSNELFTLMDENGEPTDRHPEVAAAVKEGARLAIDVEWDDHGKTRRLPVNEWFQHSVKTTAMMAGPWLYSGSDFQDGKFIPATTGDLIAIWVDPGAIINYPGSDNGDNIWFGYPKRVPPEGTPVTLIISPYTKSPALPKP